MMIRGDQHVDDWAEIAVDYLDGQLDQQTRQAVEAHLSGCPTCAARLRRQQYVVNFLQQTPLDDPPEDLEYRSIGEIIFPSPGTEPIIRPREEAKVYRSGRWYRTLRAWVPATVAVIALIAAVVGYGVARSGHGTEVATESVRMASTTTVAAAAATTAAPALGDAAPTATGTGTGTPKTTAAAGSTTTAVASAATTAGAGMSTFAATEDPKAMVRALESAQTPTYVAFRAAGTAQTDQVPATDSTASTSASSTETTAGATTTTAAAATTETTTAPPAGSENMAGANLTPEQATALIDQIKEFTGLDPVDRTLWIDGPTFAVFLPRRDAAELVDMIRSMSSSFGLTVSLEGAPPSQAEERSAKLLEQKKKFPVLEAIRALQPSTWNYDFTTSTLTDNSGSAKALPDADGSHVVVVIWIAQ